MAKSKRMTDDDVKDIVVAEVRDSVGYIGQQISEDRRKASKYYRGDHFGWEQDGRSKVVVREVADTIEWMMPSLMRVFTAGDDVVDCIPVGPEDEGAAENAKTYLNHIFYNDNDGWEVLQTWFKDALLHKLGVVKFWWDEREIVSFHTFEGLDNDEYLTITSPDNHDIVEHTENEEVTFQADPMTGEEIPVVTVTHDVKIKRRREANRFKIVNVPPEEFLVSKRESSLQTARFIGHHAPVTRQDLIADGYDYDTVMGLPAYNEFMTEGEKEQRYADEDYTGGASEFSDPMLEEVGIVEAYIRADRDGDGVAELLMVKLGGIENGEILEIDEVDRLPFAVITPIPVPHKIIGLSIADLTMDLQEIKSTLLRQMLDNLYLSNNPEREVVLNGIEDTNQLVQTAPGNNIFVKAPNTIRELVRPFTAGQSLPMMQYLDEVNARRTGVSRQQQGIDADALQNQSATAANLANAAANQRMEMIARQFAETGVRDLFKAMLEMVIENQNDARQIRISGNKWVKMDPRSWDSDMDIRVSVGLGHGNRDQQLQQLSFIAQKQEQLMGALGPENPIVGLAEYRNTMKRVLDTVGIKNIDAYFKDPTQAPPAPPPAPDPNMLMLQAQERIENAKAANKQAELELNRYKADQSTKIDLAKIRADLEKTAAKIESDNSQAAADIQLRAEIEQVRTDNDNLRDLLDRLERTQELGVPGV
jgi:hypothetical protein